MVPPSPSESNVLSSLAHSPQLQGRSPRLSPELEAEHARARLAGTRTLIRAACTLAALLTTFRAAEQAITASIDGPRAVPIAIVVGSSILLAIVAWSRAFERFYMPLAQIVVPTRNMLGAALVVEIATRGAMEMLMALPLMVIGPFFFLGLHLRAALVTVSFTIITFAVSAVIFGLDLPVALRAAALLAMSAAVCAIAARHVEETSRKSFLESRLIAELAQHDALTGLKNRRVFDEHLDWAWQQCVDNERSIAILLIDVDQFKAYNDLYGHQAGDRALRRVAQMLQTFVARPLDVLARYGGEEFAVILYDVDGRQAQAVAERMRRAVGGLAIEHRGSRVGAVTISIGVALVAPSAERRARGALQLADQALYEAKVHGRNRVELMDQTAHQLLVTGVFKRKSLAQAP
jgi:diguanylate cyclase (GGDEF)-like protein